MKYLFTVQFSKFMRHYLILKSQEKYSFEGKQHLDLKCFLHFEQDCLVLVSSAGPDEMLHFVVLHRGLHSLPKYLLKGFEYTNC